MTKPRLQPTFTTDLLRWYQVYQRDLPWRQTKDPYRILVSEIMLQQTQVERVRCKYAEFLATFPTVETLASASLTDVLLIWQGLGYNRRAIALKRCAEEIVSRFGGQFRQGQRAHVVPRLTQGYETGWPW